MPFIIRSPKDFFCGLLLLAVAGVFAIGLRELDIGSAFRMGPGYFPLVLTLLLGALGLAITVNGLRVQGEPVGALPWRGLILIVLPVIFFGLTLRGLGLVPALSISVFLTTLASREWNLWVALATTFFLVLGCVALFSYGLGLPISLFGRWVGGY